MQNRLCLLLFLIFINATSLHGQTRGANFRGYIVDSTDGSRLENVICEAFDSSQKLVAYYITGKEGDFSFENRGEISFFVFKLLGYKNIELSVTTITDSENITITLERGSITLNELIVTAPAIRQIGDTLRYSVKHFKGQEDRYIVDVLKKLPGIRVTDDGKISYQGQAINKFYIEGRDLLGGQYNLASNNLNVDAVNFVEVLENNQHVKALKGLVFAEQAAINIKLNKEYKARPFGEIKLSAGWDPFLYDERLFVSYIGRKTQTMANFKINNLGNYILSELEDQFDFSRSVFELLAPDLISHPSSTNIPLPIDRHLFNKTYLGSLSTLIPLSKESELNIKLSYGAEKSDQEFYSLQNWATGGDDIEIEEQSALTRKIDNSRLSVGYENNAMERFIKNEVVYFSKRTRTTSGITSNERNLSSYNKSNPYYIQNNFGALFKSKTNQTFTLSSFIRYSKNDELLNVVYDAEQNERLDELLGGEYLTSKNQLSTSFNLFNQRLSLALGAIYKKRKLNISILQKALEGLDGIELADQKDKTELMQFDFIPSYQIMHGSKLVINIDLPVTFNKYRSRNIQKTHFSDQKLIFNPSVRVNYKIDHIWEIYARVGYDFRYADDISLLENPYFRSYRMIYIPSGDLNSSRNLSALTGIRYKNIVRMLFFNFNILYRDNKYNFISQSHNTNDWSYYTTANQRSKGRTFTIFTDISKNFIPSNLALTIGLSYMQMKSQVIQQSILVDNTGSNAMASVKLEYKPITKLSIIYDTEGRVTWNNNKLTKTTPLKDIKQKMSLYFFPKKSIDFSVIAEHTLHEKSKNSHISFLFMDIVGRYRYKRFEFGIMARNIFDKNLYAINRFSSVNSLYQQLPLRGREFLFTTSFSF